MEENNSLSNKYDAALAKYNTHLSDADIQARVADLIEKKVPENNTEEVKKFLFTCIDLTTLNSTDSDESVMRFTEKVNQFDDEFPDLKNVAAICVYPNFAAIVKNTLEVDGVNIACVSGGFPSSQTFTEVKVAETALAIADGADEIAVDRVPGVRRGDAVGRHQLRYLHEPAAHRRPRHRTGRQYYPTGQAHRHQRGRCSLPHSPAALPLRALLYHRLHPPGELRRRRGNRLRQLRCQQRRHPLRALPQRTFVCDICHTVNPSFSSSCRSAVLARCCSFCPAP